LRSRIFYWLIILASIEIARSKVTPDSPSTTVQ
jgi:hypothetical protein